MSKHAAMKKGKKEKEVQNCMFSKQNISQTQITTQEPPFNPTFPASKGLFSLVQRHWRSKYIDFDHGCEKARNTVLHSEYCVLYTWVMWRTSINANTFSLGNVRFYSIHGGRRMHLESSWIQHAQ